MNLLAALLFLAAQQQLNQTIVVTASEMPETIESTPAAVTVITKKQIDERAARDVADVLREVPGLQLSRSGSDGKATSLFSRGAASTQTLVLWNGIEMNNPYFSGFDWGRFSTAGVEQVEVVRGPFSALYGSEAMGGVINVLTTPHASGVRAEVQGGERGLKNGVINGAYAGGPFEVVPTPGHSRDSVCLLYGRVCFSGDTVLGEGSVFIPGDGGGLAGYLESLESLLALEIDVICPGHGPIVSDAHERIAHYIEHRLERERKVLAALEAGARTDDEILASAWDDAPIDSWPMLRAAAAATLAAHLDKLRAEGRLPT